MAWTYVGTLPTDPATATAAERRDWVRTKVGDVVSTNPLATDEQIASSIAENGGGSWRSLYLSAADIAESIAARFPAQKAGKVTVGKTSVEYGESAASFLSLAKSLRAQAAAKSFIVPAVLGVSVADNQAAAADTSRVQPAAYRGQDSYPGTIPTLDTVGTTL